MSVLSFLFDEGPKPTNPIDPGWYKSLKGLFPRLIHVRPQTLRLEGIGGVFVIWHSGVQPAWVCCGKAADLSQVLEELMDTSDVVHYDERGGLFVTWSTVREEYRDGVVNYLRKTFDFKLEDGFPGAVVNVSAEPIPVTPPGQDLHEDIE